MIDLHAHILPGVDDGVKNDAEAVKAARQASAFGVDSIVATPHVIPGVFVNNRSGILEAVARLQGVLDNQEVAVRVFPGAEYYVEPDLPKKLAQGELLTVNDRGQHVLVELPMQNVPAYVDQVLFDLLVRGVTPVLAHPERNRELVDDPGKLYRLVQKGILVQVTAGSLLGMFGREARTAAEFFVRQRWVHFLASDLHGAGERLLALKEAVEKLAGYVGNEGARMLVEENPRCVLVGERVDIGELLPFERRRGGLFSTLMGRIKSGR